jgi:hypothetical protein
MRRNNRKSRRNRGVEIANLEVPLIPPEILFTLIHHHLLRSCLRPPSQINGLLVPMNFFQNKCLLLGLFAKIQL